MIDVLLVDDKEENRYFLHTLLSGYGYRTSTACHGAEALAMARQRPPGLVISDLLMPVMDGYTLLRHWRSDPRLSNVPFIVYTATYTEPEDEKLAFDLGADAFILKPAEPQDFMRQVEAILAMQDSRRPADIQLAPYPEPEDTFRAYSQTLIRKLEEKTSQLEEANRTLHADIEKRKRTEEALYRSEAEFRALADAMPQIVWVSQTDGKVTSFNHHWASYTGLEDDTVKDWAQSLHPDDRATELVKWADAIASGGTYSSEFRLRRFDSEYRWWLARAVPLLDEKGRPVRWIGTFTDIHDLKVTQESLRRSQRIEALGKLSGGIAHDFNNILQVILVNVEKLEESEALPSEMRDVVVGISRSVDQAGDLISRLMTFSRRQTLQPTATDVNDLISNTTKLLHLALGEQIELVLFLESSLGWANIDRSLLESALINLCINARDAMPHGGQLTIETRNATVDSQSAASLADAASGDYVQIIVTDTGTGIAPDVLDRVFEPFFSTKDEGKGTGLGLSMVYGFIKQSKGHVTIDSTLGKGTRVSLYLPSMGVQTTGNVAGVAPEIERYSGRILLVEDSLEVRESIRMQLERLGYMVTEASNGSEALDACFAQTPAFDLLLSDISMAGGMNGWALCEQIGVRWPTMARVLMSGDSQDPAPETMPGDRRVVLLPKPFRIRDLERVLVDALGSTGTSTS